MSKRRFTWKWNDWAVALVAVLLGCLLAASQSSRAQTLTVLHHFAGGTDGNWPYSRVAFDSKGNLYATTFGGGGQAGCGIVFKLTPPSGGGVPWKETILHSFSGQPDACNPNAGLLPVKGDVYGVANVGAADGNGGVFELLPPVKKDMTEKLAYSFAGPPSDGANPDGDLIQDPEGNIYGVTLGGGAYNNGTVFELTPSGSEWNEIVLYSFCSQTNCTDGANPQGGLARDSKGNLYGTTVNGGANNRGTVFELTLSDGTWKETVLYSFCSQINCSDGANPQGDVIFSGHLYGTTFGGGANSGGTVFEIIKENDEKVLYSFCSSTDCADGANPLAGLALSKGNFYGTTSSGGTGTYGTIFELTPSGSQWMETVLHNFTGGADGGDPRAGLVLDKEDNLYGTTVGGGSANCSGGCGVVFKLTP